MEMAVYPSSCGKCKYCVRYPKEYRASGVVGPEGLFVAMGTPMLLAKYCRYTYSDLQNQLQTPGPDSLPSYYSGQLNSRNSSKSDQK